MKLKYKHLGVFLKCKSAPHPKEWIKDIAGDQLNYKTLGPDCCFIGTKKCVFFGKNHIQIDENFCKILKNGTLFRGTLDKNLVNVNNPIHNPRGNHLVLSRESATRMVEKLNELGDTT